MGARALLRRLPRARRMAGWSHDNSQSVSFKLTRNWHAARDEDAIVVNTVAVIISDNVSFLERDPVDSRSDAGIAIRAEGGWTCSSR
jgi:hypothetical protein